jgi:purine-binding chemotaxis protein CheW
MAVREIRGWSQATALPHSPDYVCGVVNLRGLVLPVIDLKARLGLGATTPSGRSVVIVAEIDSLLVGLLVDAVSEILAADKGAIQPTPNVGSAQVNQSTPAIIVFEDRMISWIALDHVLPNKDAAAA